MSYLNKVVYVEHTAHLLMPPQCMRSTKALTHWQKAIRVFLVRGNPAVDQVAAQQFRRLLFVKAAELRAKWWCAWDT
jgi:hypothetical protein